MIVINEEGEIKKKNERIDAEDVLYENWLPRHKYSLSIFYFSWGREWKWFQPSLKFVQPFVSLIKKEIRA